MTGNEAYDFDRTASIIDLVIKEGYKARMKHGDAPLAINGEALSVLMEEVGEVATAMNQNLPTGELRKELVQVASVAIRWLAGDLTFSRKP
jgi:NTP pyrophosphatase (non-canonical NTP hydrolase)